MHHLSDGSSDEGSPELLNYNVGNRGPWAARFGTPARVTFNPQLGNSAPPGFERRPADHANGNGLEVAAMRLRMLRPTEQPPISFQPQVMSTPHGMNAGSRPDLGVHVFPGTPPVPTQNNELMATLNTLVSQVQDLKTSLSDRISALENQQHQALNNSVPPSNVASGDFVPPSGIKTEEAPPPPKQSHSVSGSTSANKRPSFSLKFKDLQLFDGSITGVHPKEFIAEVETYYQCSSATDEMRLVEVRRLLRGDAKAWYQIYNPSFTSFAKFKEEFLKYFWGPRVQNSVRQAMLSPNQKPPECGQLATNFLNKVKCIRYFDEPVPEQQVVSTVMSQFPYDIRSAVVQANADTVGSVLDILRGFDQLGPRPTQQYQKSSAPSAPAQPRIYQNNSRSGPGSQGIHQVKLETDVPDNGNDANSLN